mgnify:CR=1 FL=1
MSKIRSTNTNPELFLRVALKGNYLRYQPKGVLGNPDFASKKHKIAVFVDGDFWHGYNWKKLDKVPPRKYWQKKIQKNIDRAKKYNKMLKKEGWKVVRLWEHEIKKNEEKCIKLLKQSYKNHNV